MKTVFLFVLLFSIGGGVALAQDYGVPTQQESDLASQSLNDFLIVAGAGLGGAVLGLSTLSFVEEPSEHTNNILVGGALGIIAGVIVVVYLKATETTQQMSTGGQYQSYYAATASKLETVERSSWYESDVAFQLPLARWSF